VNRIADALYDRVAEGTIAWIDVVFSHAHPGGSIEIERHSLLPIDLGRFVRPVQNQPPLTTLAPWMLLERLASEYAYAQLCEAAMHAFAAENEARMKAMAAAKTNIESKHRIENEQTGLDWLADKVAVDDRRRRALDRFKGLSLDLPLAVKRPAERIDNAAEQPWSDRDARDFAGAAHAVAGLHAVGLVKKNASHSIAIKRKRKAHLTAPEADQFIKTHPGKSRHERNAVRNPLDAADLLCRGRKRCCLNPLPRMSQPVIETVLRAR
jgi:ATP synthase